MYHHMFFTIFRVGECCSSGKDVRRLPWRCRHYVTVYSVARRESLKDACMARSTSVWLRPDHSRSSKPWKESTMFIALRERRAEEFDQLCATFASYLSTNMAARASTASAPSLRSKTPVDMERPFTPPDGDGGNVKVVVRVRKFIKRGAHANAMMMLKQRVLTGLCRAGKAIAMHHTHEPRDARDNHPAPRSHGRLAKGARGEKIHLRQVLLVA